MRKALRRSMNPLKLRDSHASTSTAFTKVGQMADKTDNEIYGKNGALPQVNAILKDIVGKLHKLDKTIDNINVTSADTSEGMKFSHVCPDIDDLSAR